MHTCKIRHGSRLFFSATANGMYLPDDSRSVYVGFGQGPLQHGRARHELPEGNRRSLHDSSVENRHHVHVSAEELLEAFLHVLERSSTHKHINTRAKDNRGDALAGKWEGEEKK